MSFEYVTRLPPPALAPFVEVLWWARGQITHAREKIAPTGSTVAVLVLGSPIRIGPTGRGAHPPIVADAGFVIGPHDVPVVNEPLAETWAVGVVTTPVGCRAALGVDPLPLHGRVVPVAAGWPAGTDLRDVLRAGDDPDAGLDAVEARLLATVEPEVSGLDLAVQAVAALEGDPVRPVADLAAELGVSHGHLDRTFRRVVGLSPATLRRILRVRRVLEQLDAGTPPNWSRVAAAGGWFDQSHFTRDFRRHTGVAPTGYLAALRRFYEPDEHVPGFVPED